MRKLGLAAALAATVALAGCADYPGEYGYDSYGPGYSQNGYYGPEGYYRPYDNGAGYYGPDGYYHPYDNRGANVAAGAAIGAATGAVAGAVLPGVSPVGGAVAGAVLGGVIAASVNGRQYYRDQRGYCYFVDQYGNPHYSYDIRC